MHTAARGDRLPKKELCGRSLGTTNGGLKRWGRRGMVDITKAHPWSGGGGMRGSKEKYLRKSTSKKGRRLEKNGCCRHVNGAKPPKRKESRCFWSPPVVKGSITESGGQQPRRGAKSVLLSKVLWGKAPKKGGLQKGGALATKVRRRVREEIV